MRASEARPQPSQNVGHGSSMATRLGTCPWLRLLLTKPAVLLGEESGAVTGPLPAMLQTRMVDSDSAREITTGVGGQRVESEASTSMGGHRANGPAPAPGGQS